MNSCVKRNPWEYIDSLHEIPDDHELRTLEPYSNSPTFEADLEKLPNVRVLVDTFNMMLTFGQDVKLILGFFAHV